MRPLSIATLLILCFVFPATVAQAQDVPDTLTHQGRLVDDDGEPVTGEVELIYSLYDAPTGGDILWQQSVITEADETGFYSVEIGDQDPPLLPLLRTSNDRWIGIIVDGGGELRPRVAMSSVPYAWLAREATVARAVEEGSITTESLADDFTLPDQHLGGLSCATGDLARFNGSQWECETTDSFQISGDAQVAGQVDAESFHSHSTFDEEARLDTYPQGVSWQTGRGTNAPGSSMCRYGIVQTMFFGNCRARQICYERDGTVFGRYLDDHCNPSGPWGEWVQTGL